MLLAVNTWDFIASMHLNLVNKKFLFNTLASGWFWQFLQKKQQFSFALPTP